MTEDDKVKEWLVSIEKLDEIDFGPSPPSPQIWVEKKFKEPPKEDPIYRKRVEKRREVVKVFRQLEEFKKGHYTQGFRALIESFPFNWPVPKVKPLSYYLVQLSWEKNSFIVDLRSNVAHTQSGVFFLSWDWPELKSEEFWGID